LTTRSDAIRWRTLDDAREEDGWVADLPEPSPTQSADFSDVLEDYERDSSGRVVYAARGFFYDGVRPSDAVDFGMTERVKVGVGIVGKKRERVFALRKVLGSRGGVAGVESDVFVVTMDRPLGVVVERDVDGRVRVADFVEGSRAGRAAAVAQLQGLNENSGARAARRGDVIRAFTTTTLSYGPRAQLLGDLSGTKRAVVLFGADDQPWGKTIGALKSGLVADGPVTLILERDRDAARAEAWTPEPTPPPEVEKKKSAAPVSSRSIEGAEKRKALRTVGSPSVDDRERVSQAPSVVPDPVNASLLVAGRRVCRARSHRVLVTVLCRFLRLSSRGVVRPVVAGAVVPEQLLPRAHIAQRVHGLHARLPLAHGDVRAPLAQQIARRVIRAVRLVRQAERGVRDDAEAAPVFGKKE
jgi:hypothetical protein